VEVTEVRIQAHGRWPRAAASLLLDHVSTDAFVIRDLKITKAPMDHSSRCPAASSPRMSAVREQDQPAGRVLQSVRRQTACGSRHAGTMTAAPSFYADIAHPINSAVANDPRARDPRFHQELERAKLPGYISRYDDSITKTPRRRAACAPHGTATSRCGAHSSATADINRAGPIERTRTRRSHVPGTPHSATKPAASAANAHARRPQARWLWCGDF